MIRRSRSPGPLCGADGAGGQRHGHHCSNVEGTPPFAVFCEISKQKGGAGAVGSVRLLPSPKHVGEGLVVLPPSPFD